MCSFFAQKNPVPNGPSSHLYPAHTKKSAPISLTSIGTEPQLWLTSSISNAPCAWQAAASFAASTLAALSNRTWLTDTSRVRGVSAAMKSSAVWKALLGLTMFSFIPSRSSIRRHVAYSSGNSPLAVITTSPAFHHNPIATAIVPVLAPEVSATSSAFPPINFAIAARTRFGTSKNAASGIRCGNFVHSTAAWIALIAALHTGLCPARFKYVAPSNSCHSLRQSTIVAIPVAISPPSFFGVRRLDAALPLLFAFAFFAFAFFAFAFFAFAFFAFAFFAFAFSPLPLLFSLRCSLHRYYRSVADQHKQEPFWELQRTRMSDWRS